MDPSDHDIRPWEDSGTVIYQDDEYTVVIEEVEPLWRWLIFRDNLEVQEGASISERSARLAGLKVASYLRGAANRTPASATPEDSQ